MMKIIRKILNIIIAIILGYLICYFKWDQNLIEWIKGFMIKEKQ